MNRYAAVAILGALFLARPALAGDDIAACATFVASENGVIVAFCLGAVAAGGICALAWGISEARGSARAALHARDMQAYWDRPRVTTHLQIPGGPFDLDEYRIARKERKS